MAKTKIPNKLTVRGVAVYPKTNRPFKWDKAAGRSVPDPNGEFELQLRVEAAEAERVEKLMIAFASANGMKKPDLPIKAEEDEDQNETGKFIIKSKQFGTNKDGSPKRIAHFDSAAKPLPRSFILTGGSEVFLDAYMTTREMPTKGVKLNINAVQVINYVEIENNPFEAVNGGFVAGSNTDGDEDAPFEDNGEEDEASTDF